jgi:L-amino acid N-acyltransferase YncA
MGDDAGILREVTLRDADAGDAESIAALYAHYVHTSIATFEETPPDRTEIGKRIAAVQDAGLPWIVATDLHGALLGYAYASPYRTRSAYRYTIENSVYVAPRSVGSGIGVTMMREIIRRCADLGYRQMLAVIGDSANVASIALHASLGFTTVGTHLAVGYKHGRWVDVVHMQLALGDGAQSPPDSANA